MLTHSRKPLKRLINNKLLSLTDTKRFVPVKQRKLSFFGHIIRHDNLIDGKRGRGRQKLQCKRDRGRPRLQWDSNIL